jgi:hypothetical protein
MAWNLSDIILNVREQVTRSKVVINIYVSTIFFFCGDPKIAAPEGAHEDRLYSEEGHTDKNHNDTHPQGSE